MHEIFPAALISKWLPAHVTLFANGKGMITGIKDEASAVRLLSEIEHYIASL